MKQVLTGNTVFSSPEPKAPEELMWSLPDCLSTLLNNSSSETPEQIFFKLHLEPSVERRLKIYINSHGRSNNMAAMPIYGKKHLRIFSSTKKALRLNLDI